MAKLPAMKPVVRILLAMSLASIIAVQLFWFLPLHDLDHGRLQIPCSEIGRGEGECEVGPGTQGWVPLPLISKHLQHAILAAEDARFYAHHGVDWREIKLSFELNWAQQRYARGASTLSQQLVRMAFLSREKSLWRKVREVASALYLELLLSKDEILEWYLNLVSFGPGESGIGAAAERYFDTKPVFLTIEQAVNLALVLPSPTSWSTSLRQEKLTEDGRRRFRRILAEMYRLRYITREQRDYTLATGDFGSPLQTPVSPRPFQAPVPPSNVGPSSGG